MKRNWTRKIINALGLTTAMFIFQACYGPAQDYEHDIFIEGIVKSKTTGLPVQGIKISVTDNYQYGISGADGKFYFYSAMYEKLYVKIEDGDQALNGLYESRDTTIFNPGKKIFLNIILAEK
jgi:hypothetical protein